MKVKINGESSIGAWVLRRWEVALTTIDTTIVRTGLYMQKSKCLKHML